jgi:hypothetical protein
MVNLKKLLILLALMSVSAVTVASTIDLGQFDGSNTVTTKQFVFSPGISLDLIPGESVDANVLFNVHFSGLGDDKAFASAGAFSLELKDFVGNGILGIENVGATLSGGTLGSPMAFDLSPTIAGVALSFTGILGAGDYVLSFSGDVPTSYTGGGSLTGSVSIAAVPIPAAVWLFGSALVGLFGARRRTVEAVLA